MIKCTAPPQNDQNPKSDADDGVLKIRLSVLDAGNDDAVIGRVDLDASKYIHDAGHLGHLGFGFCENVKYNILSEERSAEAIAADVPEKWFSASIRLDVTIVSKGKSDSTKARGSSLSKILPGKTGIGGPVFRLKLKRMMQVFPESSNRLEDKSLVVKLAKQRKRDVMFSVVALFTFLIIGTCAYPALEGWDFHDGLWFGFVTLTTVGYGDISRCLREDASLQYFMSGWAFALLVLH